MKKCVVLAMFSLFLSIMINRQVFAVDEMAIPGVDTASVATDETNPADELEYSFGEVKSISSADLVLTEYDYLTDKESDVTYSVDPAVKFENAASVNDIKNGDSIEIDYQIQGDKKIVKNIILEKLDDELAGDDLGMDDMSDTPAAGAEDAAAKTAVNVDDVAKQ